MTKVICRLLAAFVFFLSVCLMPDAQADGITFSARASQTEQASGSAPAAGVIVIYDPYNIVVSCPDGRSLSFPASQPLVVTRDMEGALFSMPIGSRVRFTSAALNARMLDLRYFDTSCLKYYPLRDGFELEAIVDYGNAQTTFITLDGVPFNVKFVFVPNDQPAP